MKLILLLPLLAVCGCSTFNYEWRREARRYTPSHDIAGRWEGKWVSEVTRHSERLQCLVSRAPDGSYRARFRATYERFLHFSYTVPLECASGTNGVQFHGTADLGKLAGGVYEYSGHATPTNFFCTYQARQDHGTFQMARPKEESR